MPPRADPAEYDVLLRLREKRYSTRSCASRELTHKNSTGVHRMTRGVSQAGQIFSKEVMDANGATLITSKQLDARLSHHHRLRAWNNSRSNGYSDMASRAATHSPFEFSKSFNDDNRKWTLLQIMLLFESLHDSKLGHSTSAPCRTHQHARSELADTIERHKMDPAV